MPVVVFKVNMKNEMVDRSFRVVSVFRLKHPWRFIPKENERIQWRYFMSYFVAIHMDMSKYHIFCVI